MNPHFKFAMICLLAFSAGILSGCSSCGLKGQCEDTNWYQYGVDLAMSGKRIEQDNFISQCRKVEAEIAESKLDVGFKAGMAQYCTPEAIFQVGREGRPFNEDICDARLLPTLKAQHAKGVVVFCAADNAYQFGLSGKKYAKICPVDLEAGFLVSYKKGRKIFLTSESEAYKKKLIDTQNEIHSNEMEQMRLRNLQLMLPAAPHFDPNTGTVPPDPYIGERQNLENQIRMVDSNLLSLRGELQRIKNTIDELRHELILVE